MIQGEAAASGKNYCDATFVDAKIIRDTTFYKNIIKRLKDELEKIKSENEQLRETVVAYSIKLPQVSMKLNTLVTCLEARVYKLNRLKKNRTKDDGGDSPSSLDSSLSGEDDRGCDELRDDGSEEDVGQTIQAPTNTGRHHSVQNFVEVICEEESSIGDAVISRGCVQNETLRDRHHEEGKNKVDNTVENNVKSLLVKTTAGHPHRQRSIAQEKVHTSKANHAKHSVVKRKTKRKVSLIHDKYHPSHQAEKSNGASKDCKSLPKPLLVDEDASKIKIEESHDGNVVVANKVADKSKGSKFGMKLHKSAISMGSNLEAVNASDSRMGENTSNLCRRGRKRAYDCEVCGRTFARSSNLAHHVMRHRNERPHRCEICDRAFVQKANLKVHLRSHTGERPFSCPECGRAFAQKNNALRHLRAHVRQRQLQEQKLVCPVCAKSFGRWPSYETHMRRAHGSSESNSMVQMTHSMVEGMVNSPLSGGSSQSQEINIGNPHPVVGIPHHTGNAMAGSPIGHPHIEHVHSPSMPLVNAHPSDAISSVPLPTSHHSQTDHIVVSNTMDAQLSARHGCGDSAC